MSEQNAFTALQIDMYEQKDMSYVSYCTEHPDIFDCLTSEQISQYKQFMNEGSTRMLRSTGAGTLVDNSVKFEGFTGEWGLGLSHVDISTNVGICNHKNIKNFFPHMYMAITSTFNSFYSDLQYISYLIREDKVDLWKSRYTPNDKEVFSTDYTAVGFEMCRKFYNVGLPIPISLLGEYKKAETYAHRDTKLKKFYSQIGYDYTEFVGTKIKFYDLVNSQIISGDVPTTDTEMAKIVAQFNTALIRVQALGHTPEELIDYPVHQVYKTAGRNGLRYATLGEMQSLPVQTTVTSEVLLDKQGYEMVLVFCWFCTGIERIIKLLNRFSDNTLSSLNTGKTRKIVQVVLDYMLSPEFVTDLAEVDIKKCSITYPITAEDEVIDIPFQDKCKQVATFYKEQIARSGGKRSASSYDKMILDIAQRFLRGNVELTQKQTNVLNGAYAKLKDNDTKDNFFTPEVEKKIAVAKQWFRYSSNEVPFKIMDNVLKFKKCSEKQLSVINDQYEKALQEQADGELPPEIKAPPKEKALMNTPVGFTGEGDLSAKEVKKQTKVPQVPFDFSNCDWAEVDI